MKSYITISFEEYKIWGFQRNFYKRLNYKFTKTHRCMSFLLNFHTVARSLVRENKKNMSEMN